MEAVKYACIACPADCTNSDLPAVDFSNCVDSMVSEESEITDIFMTIPDDANPGDPLAKPTDWTTKAAWDLIIASSGLAKVRQLTVIGDLAEPEGTVRTVSKRRRILGEHTFTLNFDIDDISLANYDFMRRLQCGASVVIWYATAGGFLYGGPNGFQVDITKAGQILERGDGNYAVLRFQVQWKAKCSPPRIENPMAVAA